MNPQNLNKLTAVCFVLISAGLAAAFDSIGAYICMGVGIILYGFINWLEKDSKNQAEKTAEKFKAIDEQIQAMRLGKAIGR